MEPGSWSAAGMYRQVQSHSPQSQVCVVMTDSFLEFSRSVGNDLSTPRPEFGFHGLSDGDRWCLCVTRWKEALEVGCAPQVDLRATHISSLEFVTLDDLKRHAVDEA